jgi:hypothetical protein
VLALDGWADRLIVLSNCAWVLLAAWDAIQIRRKHSNAIANAQCVKSTSDADVVRCL